MKIDFLSSDGIHKSEKEALERIRQVFNESSFSRSWHGYAGFEVIDPTQGDREIDLILITHDRMLLIELKNWHGTIRPMNDRWLLNNNDMGRSPVKVSSLKLKILHGKMKKRLPEPARSVRNDYRVVLCGKESYQALTEEERGKISRLDDFLKLSKEGNYIKMFGAPSSVRATDHLDKFGAFFRGPEFKATSFSFHNFQIDGEAIFVHPEGVYKEYRALKQDDRRVQALLRRWDFSSLSGRADTMDERSKIGLREQRVLAFVQENNEELYTNLFQPLAFPTRDNVDADFCELYRLPPRQTRLSGFINKYRDVLTAQDRVALVKILISQFADLHDLGVAHRDIGDHTIWLERPSKVSISGLLVAYFPEVGTIGGLQNFIRAGAVLLPEDSEELGANTPTDPFRRDVYLLGVVAHHLLYLRPPTLAPAVNLHVWEAIQDDPYLGRFNDWLKKSLDIVPADRFANAREMLNALNTLRTPSDRPELLDLREFNAYESEALPMMVYPWEVNLRQGRTHVYQSSFADKKVCVKIWYGLRPDPKRPGDTHQLLDFLNEIRLTKAQPCKSIASIVDYGICQAGTFVVTEWIEGPTLSDYKAGTTRAIVQTCKDLVEAVIQLHALQLAHGDLSPEHVILDNGQPRFIDFIDFFPGGGAEAHNTAYGPQESEGATAEERDCYAVAKICSELLVHPLPDDDLDLQQLFDNLARCLTRDQGVYRLDRIQAELHKLLAPRVPPTPQFDLRERWRTTLTIVPSDNGSYHVNVASDNKRPTNVMFTFTGVRTNVLVSVEKSSRTITWIKLLEIPHSQFVRQANRALAQIPGSITITPGTRHEGSSVVMAALAIPSVLEAFEELVGASEKHEVDTQTISLPSSPNPSTRDIWRAILSAEEATLPEVEISGKALWDLDSANKLHIPYSKEGPPLDYDFDDSIKVVQEIDGEFIQLGDVNTKDTSTSVLVVDRVDRRLRQMIGEAIKLQSTRDRASFQKRRAASHRIADQQSVIPNLLDYFDPSLSPTPLQFSDEPTDEDFKDYDIYKDGQLTSSLNTQQREAFQRLWRSGPVSLLQGPPGTGKTAFIASFIHYALKKGARYPSDERT